MRTAGLRCLQCARWQVATVVRVHGVHNIIIVTTHDWKGRTNKTVVGKLYFLRLSFRGDTHHNVLHLNENYYYYCYTMKIMMMMMVMMTIMMMIRTIIIIRGEMTNRPGTGSGFDRPGARRKRWWDDVHFINFLKSKRFKRKCEENWRRRGRSRAVYYYSIRL